MAKVADVKLGWTKSPSSDIASVKLVITKDGADITVSVDAAAESFQIVVEASKTVSFKIITIDKDGLTATSDTYTFTLSDLEAPLPATNLFHEVVAVREV